MKNVPLSPKWRHALEMLANAGERGSAEAALIAHGFSAEMLKSLACVGLATPVTDRARIGGQSAPRMQITNAGRQALAVEGSRLTVASAA
jgi:hypothetical protein